MRTIVKTMNWTGRNAVVCGCLWAALNLFGGGTAWAALTGYEFSRYQVILDKKPFGEVTPSEDALPQAALGEVIAKEIEMKSIVDDGSGIRIGLLDKKTNKNISLGVGENYEGLQVVSVNYDHEEAVLKKGSETVVIKLRPDKDKDKDKATASAIAPAGMAEAPFQAPNPFAAAQQSAAVRKPFFSDLKRKRGSPFQPAGTNMLPFQAKSADSFFKVSTGAFPNAQSPFGPFQAPRGSAVPGVFQQVTSAASNAPNPFAPISPQNQNTPMDSKGATIDQLLQGQAGAEGQAQPAATQVPAEDEIPAE